MTARAAGWTSVPRLRAFSLHTCRRAPAAPELACVTCGFASTAAAPQRGARSVSWISLGSTHGREVLIDSRLVDRMPARLHLVERGVGPIPPTWISTSAASSGLTFSTRSRADDDDASPVAKPSGRGDSNSRPLGPEPSTLTWLSYFPAPGPDDTTRLRGGPAEPPHGAVRRRILSLSRGATAPGVQAYGSHHHRHDHQALRWPQCSRMSTTTATPPST